MRMNGNRWTRAVSDWIPRDLERTAGRPPTRWSEFFTKSFEERNDARRVPRGSRTHCATLARHREKWKIYWHPLESPNDQRDYSVQCKHIKAKEFHLFECRSCKRKFVTPFFANFHIKEGLCKKEEGELCDDGGPALNVVNPDAVEFSSFCRLQNAITKCTGLMLHELQYGEEDLLKCACLYGKGPDSPDSPEPIMVEERQMQTSPPATDSTSSTVTSFPATSQTSASETDAKERQSVENSEEKLTLVSDEEMLTLLPDEEKLTFVSDDEEQIQGPHSPDSPEPIMLEEHQMQTSPPATNATSSAIVASFPTVSQTSASMTNAEERQSIEKYGEKLTVVSDDEVLMPLPDEEKLTVVSDDEMLTLLPDEEKLTVVSDDEMLTLLPDEQKLTVVSDDEEQAQVFTSTGSSDVPKVDVGAERSLMATSNTLPNTTPSRRSLLNPPCTSTNATSCPTSFNQRTPDLPSLRYPHQQPASEERSLSPFREHSTRQASSASWRVPPSLYSQAERWNRSRLSRHMSLLSDSSYPTRIPPYSTRKRDFVSGIPQCSPSHRHSHHTPTTSNRARTHGNTSSTETEDIPYMRTTLLEQWKRFASSLEQSGKIALNREESSWARSSPQNFDSYTNDSVIASLGENSDEMKRVRHAETSFQRTRSHTGDVDGDRILRRCNHDAELERQPNPHRNHAVRLNRKKYSSEHRRRNRQEWRTFTNRPDGHKASTRYKSSGGQSYEKGEFM